MWSKWEQFAAREPHFAVLTAPRFLQANLTPAHEREFFASGEATVGWMLNVIDAALVPEFAPMTMLEYGCGIGRLALPLARRPGSVTAVDRSPAMLLRARQEAERHQLQHISFETPEALFERPRAFDLVVCYHVLQRLPRHDAIPLVRRLCELIAPGGVGVFQWPYRAHDALPVRASRWVREHVPLVNTAVNTARGKPAGDPFIPTHVFDLPEMIAVFDDPAFRATHVALEHHEGLDYAILFAERRLAPGTRPSPATSRAAVAAARDEQADVTSAEDIERSNRAAEVYFSSLTDWSHHLAKPFSQPEETPVLLMNLAVMLQSMRLTPGMRVLDFGAGSGWLSRFFARMGCHVVVCDVSETALKMARELFERQPPIRPELPPEFLRFDGRRIDLPDASLDRIVCFDAFHHAPNPRAMIGEFGRLLVDGGMAVFAEPGPRHAGAPRSQFESQTYGVVERDVDVHDLWRAAPAHGFTDLCMSVFHGLPFQVSLDRYEELLAGGAIQEEWLASTRKFLRHVRHFALIKGGAARADSRSADGLACEIRATAPTAATAGIPVVVDATVTNIGTSTWLAATAPRGGVSLGAHLYDAAGSLISFDFHTQPLTDPPREIAAGETVRCEFVLPPLGEGEYRIEIDCVSSHVTWFALAGSRPALLVVRVDR